MGWANTWAAFGKPMGWVGSIDLVGLGHELGICFGLNWVMF